MTLSKTRSIDKTGTITPQLFKENMNSLVIVESPTKSKTLQRFLGDKYQIEASMGHIRDLPKSELGVNIEKDFEPEYIIPRDKKKRVGELKKIASSVDSIWLASDPDREGEAIAWHISQIIKHPKGDIKRVVFHEITKEAIIDAFAHPRDLDLNLVDAQQARRVLDRLVGYKLSPLLWKKVKRGLSAGRVQSVAVRLIVEREKEIGAFKPVEYWSIEVQVSNDGSKEQSFWAQLVELNGKKLPIGNEKLASEHLEALKKANYSILKIIKREVKRSPSPPFTTSTLQQAAGNKLFFTAKKTMSLAQFLYEHGLITYMRTDSFNLSPIALTQARDYIQKRLGDKYLPPSSRVFKTKSASAQEAHEAIRPTNIGLAMSDIGNQYEGLTRDHLRLYDLIWKRMVASQVADALIDQTSIEVKASKDNQNIYKLRASGSIILFDGWLRLYQVSGVRYQEEEKEEAEKNQLLPEVKEGESLNLLDIKADQHFTEPPPRYTDSSLIKKLEELGIGRPSTYAPTLSTIQERFYVERKERKLFPTPLGTAVCEFLVKYFPDIVDYDFTAQMENSLDQVAEGTLKWRGLIKDFYSPFEKKVEQTEEKGERVKVEAQTIDRNCPKCGKPLILRFGRFGKFIACSGFPECKHTESDEEKITVPCPKCGGEIVVRRTKKRRPFYGCSNYPKCDFATWNKPGEKVKNA